MDSDTKVKNIDQEESISRIQYTFTGAKLDTRNTIVSFFEPTTVKINISFKILVSKK